MSEFSIKVDQSLVNKTFDKIGPYPYNVFKFPHSQETPLNSREKLQDEMPVSYKEMEFYSNEALGLLKNQGEKFFSNEVIDEKYENNNQLKDVISLIEYKKNKKEGAIFEKQYKIEVIEEEKDAIIYATLLSANYIIENKGLFSSEEDSQLVAQAIEISKEEDLENLLFMESFNKGIGGFLKKIWKKGKKLFKSIFRWAKKLLEKIIKIKVELAKLEIDMTERPNFLLGNPLKIRSLKLRVRIIRVDLKYRIFGKWRKISFSIGNKVELSASAKFSLITDNNEVYVLPKFDKVSFRIKILGIWFTIGLTKIINKILSNRGKFLVYNLNSLVKPMQVKGLEYLIKEVKIPQSQNFIRMDINIDVKKAS